jgi:hypothetical protein
VATKVIIEELEQRVMLTVANPIQPPPLPSQPTPLQGVVGTPNSLDPQLINDAYAFNNLSFDISGAIYKADGAGETIAIVDAYGSPTIIQDAQTFDAETYYSPNESVNTVTGGISNFDAEGNFFLTVQKLGPTASTVVGDATDQEGWAKETSLDVEWAHAVAPGAHILLIEAASDQTTDLLDADVYAAQQPGVVAVSDSWGGPAGPQYINGEVVDDDTLDGYLVTPTGHLDSNGMLGGVVFLASSGDSNTNEFPADSRNVLSVGGNTTTIDLNGEIENIGPWMTSPTEGSGGGSSSTTPTFHDPIVSLDAAPETGVWIFDSTPDPAEGSGIDGGWSVIGGTSFAAPAWAGIIATIDQGLNLRGYGSMNNDQVLGEEPYDDRGTTAPGDTGPTIETDSATNTTTVLGDPASGYGILGLAENDAATWVDLEQLPGTPVPKENTFPLWTHNTTTVTSGTISTITTNPNDPYGVPDITVTPSADNLGWGWPDNDTGNIGEDTTDPSESARGGFIQDMVGGAVGTTIFSSALDTLYFTEQPLTAAAGASVDPTTGLQVSAFSPTTGTIDPYFHGAVTIGLLEHGTLVGTQTVNAVNGVATFNGLSIDQIGTFEFLASADDVNSAYSISFSVVPAAASQIIVAQQPTAAFQYNPMITPVVAYLEDSFYNIVAASGASASAQILTGPLGGVLSGNTTVTTSYGVATFNGLTFSKAGIYTLEITSPGLPAVVTGSFAVVPIPLTETHLFNGASLSTEYLFFQQARNATTYHGAPSAAQADSVLNAAVTLPNVQAASESAAAVVSVPTNSSAAAGATVSSPSVDSQLLNVNSDSTDKKLLN